MSKRHELMLRRVRLQLARHPEFPNGSSECGYDFVAPLDRNGHIDFAAWKELKDRSRVRRFWANEAEEMGHLVHKRGNVWGFHYDIHGDPSHDEAGYRFNSHTFVPGEYVSITEQDGVLRTFRVVSVVELA